MEPKVVSFPKAKASTAPKTDVELVEEIKKVLDSKEYTREKLNQYFDRYANMPFTGSFASTVGLTE